MTSKPRRGRREFVWSSVAIAALGLGAGGPAGRGARAAPATPAAALAEMPEVPGVSHRFIETNGIEMHIAEAGRGPLVVLVHGFPELWYSWRHQLPALAAAGYHAVAPDMRGYGATTAPAEVASYGLRHQIADLLGLFDALEADTAVLVGHDVGAGTTWAATELHPDRVRAHVTLGSAYAPRGEQSAVAATREFAGDRFSFLDYFIEPGRGEAELGADPHDTFRRFLYAFSGDAPPELLPYLFTERPADSGLLDGMPDPATLPAWLTEADIDVYAAAFATSGFTGALNGYRNLERDWTDLPEVGTLGITQPVLFVGGTRDSIVMFAGLGDMETTVPQLRKLVLLPRCGHWTQQERPAAVNAELLAFLAQELG